MMEKEFLVKLDLDRNATSNQAIEMRHNDNNRLILEFYQNGDLVNLNSLGIVTTLLAVKRLDKQVITLAGELDLQGRVSYILNGSSLSKEGMVEAVAQFYDANYVRISGPTLVFSALKDPTADGSVAQEKERTYIEIVMQDGPALLAQLQTAYDELQTQKAAFAQFQTDSDEAFLNAQNQRASDFSAAQTERQANYEGWKQLKETEINGAIDDAEQASIAATNAVNAKIVELDEAVETTKLNYKGYVENDAQLAELTGMQPSDTWRIANSASNGNRSATARWDGTQWIITDVQDATIVSTLTKQLDDTDGRIDNLFDGITQDSEVIDSRHSSAWNQLFGSLDARLEYDENQIKNQVRLLAMYTHTTNKEAVIESIDYETNTFYSTGHTFINNQQVAPVPNNVIGLDIQKFNTFLPSGFPANLNCFIINISANSFQIANSVNGAPLSISSSVGVDFSKWRFESVPNSTNITNLPNRKTLRILIKGRTVGLSNTQFYLVPNSISVDGWLQENGGIGLNFLHLAGNLSLYGNFLLTSSGNVTNEFITRTWRTSATGANTNEEKRGVKTSLTNGNFFMNNIIFSNAPIANGTTIEVYG